MYQCERARLSKYGTLTIYLCGNCAILDQIHYNDRRNMCLWGFLHLLNSCVSNVLESRNLSHRPVSHCSISFHPARFPIPNGTREVAAKSRLYQFVGGCGGFRNQKTEMRAR